MTLSIKTVSYILLMILLRQSVLAVDIDENDESISTTKNSELLEEETVSSLKQNIGKMLVSEQTSNESEMLIKDEEQLEAQDATQLNSDEALTELFLDGYKSTLNLIVYTDDLNTSTPMMFEAFKTDSESEREGQDIVIPLNFSNSDYISAGDNYLGANLSNNMVFNENFENFLGISTTIQDANVNVEDLFSTLEDSGVSDTDIEMNTESFEDQDFSSYPDDIIKENWYKLSSALFEKERQFKEDYYTEATNSASSTKLSDDKRYALTTISNDLSSMITLDEDEEEATYNVTRAEDNMTITEDFNSNKFLTTTTSVLLDDDAIKDVAYCLRSHKFNEYDRRYETNADTAPRRFFMENPRPPLRSLHWEVRKSCELSFSECVNYLRKKIMYTSLKRVDDTAIVIQEHNWTVNNTLQIQTVDEECKKMRRRDDILADPFEGPLERLQWRSTASYYMCWYTMKEAPELAHLNEKCDNFAYCLDTNLGPNNRDQRADDDQPFSCALYSFCPDPCCPARHLANLQHCWDSPDNPCFEGNPAGQRECAFNRTQNTDFRDIILNRWNVTCRCPKAGFEWNSLYGMCVDVDECATGAHNCDQKLEACVNLEGSFRCACKWGHVWNDQTKACTPSNALSLIKLGRKMEEGDDKKKVSLFGRIARFFSRSNGANAVKSDSRLVLFSVVLFYAAESIK